MEEFSVRLSVQYASKRSHVGGLVKEYVLRNANGAPAEFLQGVRGRARGASL